MIGAETFTCSAAALLVNVPSRVTIEIARAVVLVPTLFEENATDCKAAWYCATVALPLRVSTPPE